MRLGIFDNRGHHPLRNAPLGLQVEDTPVADARGVLLGPFEIGPAFDNHLQLVRPGIGFVQRRLLALEGINILK